MTEEYPPLTARQLLDQLSAYIDSGDIDPDKPLYVEYRERVGWRFSAPARRLERTCDTHEAVLEGW